MDKKIKVIIDDIEVEVSVNEEELAKLTKKQEPKKTGYERVENSQPYYSIDANNRVFDSEEMHDSFDSIRYKNANYYNNKTLAENNARADSLMRQLRRFATENCEEVEWDGWNKHFYIFYNREDEKLCPGYVYQQQIANVVYFDTLENIEKAINTFRDELMWYFTEYRERA